MAHGHDGSLYLNFNAPIPGRYKIETAARCGTCGRASITAKVRAPGACAREVFHPNVCPTGYGIATAAPPVAAPMVPPEAPVTTVGTSFVR